MRLKVFLVLFSCFIIPIFGQASLNCAYSGSYICSISLNNPLGFDNFTSIGGTHLTGKTDLDVNTVQSYNGTSLNVPSIICEQFPNLVELELTGRGITTLTERSFSGCRVIKNIHLWNNRINTPPVNLLVNNPLIEVFRVYGNNIVDALPEGLFDPTPNLNFFCHETNPTGKFLPQIFRGLTKMDQLHIDTMNLNEFSNCLLRPMVNLRYLRVYANQLRVLHQKSFPPTKNKLESMYFQNNLIEAIDRKIFDNTQVLSMVDFFGNICTNFSTSNFKSNRTVYLAALEPCFAEYDRRFPSDGSGSTCNFINHPVYGYTCELIKFDPTEPIMNNHPDCLSDSDITGIIFKDSGVREIPEDFFPNFPNLKFMEAVGIGLESTFFNKCGDKLKYLDVSQNSLKNIPSDAFKDCENLEEIKIDQNCISAVQSCDKNFMENLANLKKVSMRRNSCIDVEFNLETQKMEDIKKVLNKCFGFWYLR